MFIDAIYNFTKMSKYYVRIYSKTNSCERWQTLGPYDQGYAEELMCNYLKKGMCCWIEDVKFKK